MGDNAAVNAETIAARMRESQLRKAEESKLEEPPMQPQSPLDAVTISKMYLEFLQKQNRDYQTLRGSLLCGGVTDETLDLLVQDPTEAPGELLAVFSARSSDAGVPLYEPAGSVSSRPPHTIPPLIIARANQHNDHDNTAIVSPTWSMGPFHPMSPTQTQFQDPGRSNGQARKPSLTPSGTLSRDAGHDNAAAALPERNSNAHGRRTLYLTKLPERITYAKVFGIVRGGAVVDVWMKPSEHAASVSFVESSAAEAYFQYARKNDIFIDGRKIQVDWRETSRQFIILNNIMAAITRGATRNLLLTKVPASVSESRMREDLDHIHNLHVEKIEMRPNSIVVCLNSVCVALFARTCLMSRASYKGVRIDFAPDECAESLSSIKSSPPSDMPKQQKRQLNKEREIKKKGPATPAAKPKAPKNMFSLLIEGSGDEDNDEEEESEGVNAVEEPPKLQQSNHNTPHFQKKSNNSGNRWRGGGDKSTPQSKENRRVLGRGSGQ